MNLLEFTSDIVDSLAWPVAIVVIASILKRPLIELIPLLRKLKYKELELEFSETLKAIDDEIPQTVESLGIENSELQRLLELADFAPTAAVYEAWAKVEVAILECALRNGMTGNAISRKNSAVVAKMMLLKDIISKNQFDVISNLRKLRNKTARHTMDQLSEKAAAEYVGHAALMVLNLSKQ